MFGSTLLFGVYENGRVVGFDYWMMSLLKDLEEIIERCINFTSGTHAIKKLLNQ